MLGFTLSKLNLLILVTALFAIISFFLFSLSHIVVSDLAQQMVNDYAGTVDGLVRGELLCRKSSVTVPESIEYFGGLAPSQRFYYVMYVKRYPPEGAEEGKLNTLIFQIANRKERGKIIATSSIDVNAEILLYEWNSKEDLLAYESELVIDPMSSGLSVTSTKNSFVLIKEVYMGRSYLHIIGCSSGAGICETNLTKASCMLCSAQSRVSTCFPPPEVCPVGVSCRL